VAGSVKGGLKIVGNRWLSNPRWRRMPCMGDSARTNIRTYRDSFQGIGCRTGCMVHLAILGVLAVAALIYAIQIRAWELNVTVEMPAAKNVKKAPPDERPE
jgi:hypothetical protein